MSDIKSIVETNHSDGTQTFTVTTENGNVGSATWDPVHDSEWKRDDAITRATEEAFRKD